MNSNAPGPMLGFILQIPRALFHLLNANEGDVVSVEVIGDVGIEKPSGQTVSEEDKSSISSNPVTDRSTNLWKTFFNWLTDVKAGKLSTTNSHFVLYVNKDGKDGIVDLLDNAATPEDAENAISVIMNKLSDIDEGHEIWKYFNALINEDRGLFKEIIVRFDYESGSQTGEEEVLQSLKSKYVPEEQITLVKDELLGWLTQRIMSDISQKIHARISYEEFHYKAMVVFSRFRTKELIDFASHKPLTPQEVKDHISNKRTYVRQLEVIDLPEGRIVEEVANYLNADVNRTQWIEAGIIDESVATDLENKLKAFWQNKQTDISLTQKDLDAQEQGQLLLARCSNKPHAIRGETPPASTISGTYHLLADAPSLGWHKNWKSLFETKDSE